MRGARFRHELPCHFKPLSKGSPIKHSIAYAHFHRDDISIYCSHVGSKKMPEFVVTRQSLPLPPPEI